MEERWKEKINIDDLFFNRVDELSTVSLGGKNINVQSRHDFRVARRRV